MVYFLILKNFGFLPKNKKLDDILPDSETLWIFIQTQKNRKWMVYFLILKYLGFLQNIRKRMVYFLIMKHFGFLPKN